MSESTIPREYWDKHSELGTEFANYQSFCAWLGLHMDELPFGFTVKDIVELRHVTKKRVFFRAGNPLSGSSGTRTSTTHESGKNKHEPLNCSNCPLKALYAKSMSSGRHTSTTLKKGDHTKVGFEK